MSQQPESYLQQAVALSHELCAVAMAAEREFGEDNRLLAFCGALRDCAYRIQRDAGAELQRFARQAPDPRTDTCD